MLTSFLKNNHILVFKTSLNPFTVFVYKSLGNLLENITYILIIFPMVKVIQILQTELSLTEIDHSIKRL